MAASDWIAEADRRTALNELERDAVQIVRQYRTWLAPARPFLVRLARVLDWHQLTCELAGKRDG